MTNNTTDDFFTPDHERLARIADLAKVFAWIVLIIWVLLVGAKFVELQNSYTAQTIMRGESPDFWGLLGRDPSYAASIFVDLISILMQGVIYSLVLKGISLGLNMIIEIDLDKKEKAYEGN
jgi:hypothetical protein